MAMVAKAIAVFLYIKIIWGYDIGCVFEETILRSSLGAAFKELGWRFCVNAFHGYSHSYTCQVHHHPNCIEGLGLEDLETLERIFSGSNALAPIIRYASRYRRLALLTLYFRQWDHEKYSNIGQMLYNNYVQALNIIETQQPALDDALRELGITMDDLRSYIAEERNFFATLKDEDEKNLQAISYVEALQELRKLEYVYARLLMFSTLILIVW